MTCHVCGRPSAPNAAADDPRCGPCHNFGLVGFDGTYSVLIRRDFESWMTEQVEAIAKSNNLATYRPWLHALRLAHERLVAKRLSADPT